MWSVGGGVKFIKATFNSKEGVEKGLERVSSFTAGIPDWDAQFKAEQEARKEAETEQLSGVQAAILLDQQVKKKNAEEVKKNLDERLKTTNSNYALVGEDSDEDSELRREKVRKKGKHGKRSKKRSRRSSSSSSSSSSSEYSSDSISGSERESDREARKAKDKKRRHKEREMREAKRKSKSKSKSKKSSKKSKRDKEGSSKKEKRSDPVRLSEFMAEDNSDDDTPRSAISGKKHLTQQIQMKVKKTSEDRQEEKRRQHLLHRLNRKVEANQEDML